MGCDPLSAPSSVVRLKTIHSLGLTICYKMSHHCDAQSKHQYGSMQDRGIQVGSQARKSGRLDKKGHSCGDRSNHLKHLNIERMTMNLGLVHAMPTSRKINDYDETKQTPCHHDAWPKHQNGCGKIIVLITLSCPTT